MKSFGVLVEQFNVSQQSLHIILQLNTLLEERGDICPIVFYQDYGPFIQLPQFSSMLSVEAWDFEGALISTNLSTTRTSIECPRATRRLFYVWDLEWLYMKKPIFEKLSAIYQHKDVELIARSKEHYDILSKCWKKPAGIIEDFNYKQIVENIQ